MAIGISVQSKSANYSLNIFCTFRAENVEYKGAEGADQSDALHDLYCRTRSEGFGDEVQVSLLSS